MSLKQVAIRTSLWLIAGCVVSCCIAWALVWCSLTSFQSTSTVNSSARAFAFGPGEPNNRWLASIDHYPFGVTVLFLSNWKAESDQALHIPSEGTSSLIPKWSRGHRPPTDLPYGRNVTEIGAGFPFVSLRGEWHSDGRSGDGAAVVGSLVFVDQRVRDYPVIFPLIPIWMGFAMNTLVWSLILAGGVYVIRNQLFRFRSCRREIAGLCPNCAYDTRGLTTCPECGEELTKPATVEA
jgi:hypothetical protein